MMAMGQYRTIVADPPWPLKESWPSGPRIPKGAVHDRRRRALPYGTMALAELAALPVGALAERDAHLYVWAINRFLPDAITLVRGWGFRYVQTLVWAKTPMGLGPGGTFAPTVEFIVFARRGKEIRKRRVDSMWFNWPRTTVHSKKPEHFLDMVEQVSPGPYLEMYSRRHRLGWDVWGDQVESSIELGA